MAEVVEAGSIPLPVPDDVSRPFWAAAAGHVLAIQRCRRCGHHAHPPVQICTACAHPEPDFELTPVSGRGTVRSWTTVVDPFVPAFRAEAPYAVVDVELDELSSVRVVGRLVEGPASAVHLGSAVSVVFSDLTAEISVPCFRLGGGT